MKVLFSVLAMVISVNLYAADKPAVSTLIVLAVDTSLSIDDGYENNEYKMQHKGIAAALRDSEVRQTLEHCSADGVGLTYVEWAGDIDKDVAAQIIGWRQLRNGRDLDAFASEIEKIEERSIKGLTDLAGAIRFSSKLLDEAPYTADRKVITISGDGVQNVSQRNGKRLSVEANGLFVQEDRDRALAAGYVINALTILNDIAMANHGINLESYFNENVVGGPRHLQNSAADFSEYAEGLKEILLRELGHCGS